MEHQQLYVKITNNRWGKTLEFYRNAKMTTPAEIWWYRIFPNPKNNSKLHRALELSGISGIYLDRISNDSVEVKYWVD